LTFYDCPKAALICRDFSKGLRAAVAAKATLDLAKTAPTDEVFSLKPSAILDATKVIVSKEASKPTFVKLQLCEWHAVEAIKQRLVAAGCYKKEKQEKIVDLI
jgi:hypothetical protein